MRRAILVVAVAVVVVGVAQAIAGALEVGVTVDEPTHIKRATSWIEHGWYVPIESMDGDQPGDGPSASPHVYGPAFAALAQATTFVLGLGAIDEVVTTAEAWTARHLLTALLGIAAVLAVGFGVYVVTRSKLFAVWAMAALLAVPIWLGMSFFNPKDIPAASGYTLLTVGLVVAIALRGTDRRPRRSAGLAVAGLVAVGTFLAVGTRLALWVPILAALLLYLLIVFFGREDGRTLRGGGVGYPVAGLLVACALLLAIYPAAFTSPIEALVGSVSESSDFAWFGYTLTAGRLVDQSPPFWYLPVWVVASIPTIILVSAAATIVWAAIRSIRVIRRSGWSSIRRLAGHRSASLALIALQALLLPVGSIVVGATMYTGLRQFLFVVPALAMLAGIGFAWAWDAALRSRWRRYRPALGVVICLALIVPMVEQTLLFPFNYVYISPVAGLGGVNDRWETDYWWASSRAAQQRIPRNQVAYCGPDVLQKSAQGGFEAPRCDADFFASYLGPYADERAEVVDDDPQAQWVITRKRAGNHPPPECDDSQSVTRWLRGERVVIGYVLRCRRDPPEPSDQQARAHRPVRQAGKM